MDTEVLILATPAESGSRARFMQGLGRRYVKAFNHRHGRHGALWEGRYRTTVVDPSSHLLPCIRLVEQAPMRAGLATRASEWPWSSAAHHAGLKADAIVTEHPAYWQLGNTPFEREARYAREGAVLLTDQETEQLLAAARHGWPLGSEAFLQELRRTTDRPVEPRPRGRPKQTRS
jgi:putative transposase